jgi:hypothetical protein
MPTREAWQELLEQRLPPLTAYVARNRAITGFYARWYLQEPWLFKWSGMAAFASDQVGLALAIAEVLQAPHDLLVPDAPTAPDRNLLEVGRDLYGQLLGLALFIPVTLHESLSRQLLLNDLDLLKQGNDAIFADIGWAHAAYAQGGLKEIEANVRDSERESLLAGFRLIDEGAHRLSQNPDDKEAAALIAQGNVALLRHEQLNTLPSYFGRMSDFGCGLASIGAWMDFDGSPSSAPWFGGHAGPLPLLTGGKSVTRPDDRWEWIERDVLPKWGQADRSYREGGPMHRRLVALATLSPSIVSQAATMFRPIYRTLSLK